MKYIKKFWIVSLIVLLATLSGCDKKRISYTDMIKRENKEIQTFIDKMGFTVLKKMPDRPLADNEFVNIKEGVYLNIIEKGELITEEKATLLTRFSAVSIGDRENVNYNSAGPTNTNPYPLPFVYIKGSEQPQYDPTASIIEDNNRKYLCNAMMDALKYVGYGGKVRMIVSFRSGPSFTTNNGIALFFDNMTFNKKP